MRAAPLLLCGCIQVPIERDSGKGDNALGGAFSVDVDTASGGAIDYCSPVLPAETVVVTAAGVIDRPGTYLVCTGVPVTVTAERVGLVVEPYAAATVSGPSAIVVAAAGSQVAVSGEDALVVHEAGTLLTLTGAEVRTVECAAITRNEDRLDSGCP